MAVGRAAGAEAWATPGVEMVTVADAVTVAVVHHLAQADVLHLPPPAAPAMTVEDAARLLCRLSGAVRLDPPEEEYVQLIKGLPMVDYAWGQAQRAGIPPADATAAHEARALLLTHHRRTH